MKDPKERFSNKVDNYIQYRPSYPTEIITLLQKDYQLTQNSIIADIGAGPGTLSLLFLKNGNSVYAVEPNSAMRQACAELMPEYPHLHCIAGSAEATTLDDKSIDFITVGQAFHWFDQIETKKEFKRILKPNGWCILIWNERETESTPFLKAYEQLLLTFGTDYQTVCHRTVASEAHLNQFFRQSFSTYHFDNYQRFDFLQLQGRLLSSSYIPEPTDSSYPAMLETLKKIFATHQKNNEVIFAYKTKVFIGKI